MQNITDLIRNPKLVECVFRGNNVPLQDVVLKTLAADAHERNEWCSILEIPGILKLCNDLLPSNTDRTLIERILRLLLNLCADEKAAEKLLKLKECDDLVITMSSMVSNPNSEFADLAVAFLVNASRREETCHGLITVMGDAVTLPQLIDAFAKPDYNKEGQSLHMLAHVFGNITQVKDVRRFLLNKEKRWLCKLLPFLTFEPSVDRRLGCAAAVKNCSFETELHEWMLSSIDQDGADMLPYLLLPLAGPETLSDDENDSLPLDLQYLPEDKSRERSPKIRKLLLEALLLLSATRKGRAILRDRGTYYILREYHNWEEVLHVKAMLESVIQILIRTEDEIGVEDFNELEIPDHILEALDKDRIEEEKELAASSEATES